MARIVCSLSNDQQKELLAEVAATIDDLIEDKKPFNLKSVVQEFYDFIYESTGETGTAKLYASLIPTNLRISVVNKKLGKYLAPHLMDITDLEDKIENNIDYIDQYLGISPDASLDDVKKFNEEEALRKAYLEFLDAQPPLPTAVVYSARPATLFATTGESRIPGRDFSYNFIAHLIENVLPSDRSLGSVSEKTNFYVTTGNAKDLLREGDDPSNTLTSGIIQIMSDAQGNTLYFDEDYNVVPAEQGKPVFFRLRENLDTVQTIEEIAKTLNITEEEVQTGLDKQYEQIKSVKEYVERGNKVVNVISGATIGYLKINLSERKPLKNAEDLSDNNILFDSTKVQTEMLGRIPQQTYMFDRGAHRTPIPFKMNTVTSDSEFLEDSIRILMGDVVDSKGKKDKRIDTIVKKFFLVFYGQNQKIQIINGVANIEGKPATEEQLREALTVLRVNPKTGKPVFNTINLYVDFAKGSIPFYTKDEKGVIKMSKAGMSPKQYKKFIQDHAYTPAEYNDKGEFREENGYFTFETPADELNKVMIGNEQSKIKPEAKPEEKVKETKKTKGKKSKKAVVQPDLFSELPPPDSTDFSVDDYLSKFKVKNQKGEYVDLTQEEISKIKNWWSNSPLSKHVDLKVLFDFVHRNAVGQFVMSPEISAIYLYNGSDYTDLYHESFHAFLEMFTTPTERADIYETARQLEGSFVNTEGKTVKFSDASEEDLDEYLADDFQDYMVEQDKGVKNEKRDSKIQSFFKGLLEILKEFFNLSVEDSSNILTPSKKLQEVYKKLRQGEITYQGKPTDKGFKIFNKIKSIDEGAAQQSTSYSASKRITDSMSSLISQFVDIADSKQVGKFKRYSSTIMSSVPSQVYVFNYIRQEFLKKREELAQKLEKTAKEKEIISIKYTPGEVIISKDDIANYRDVVKQYNKIPTEFFTPSSTFSVFYDNTTGKRGRAPQSSIWIKNDEGYYDLIDKASGEVYIDNVDLKTGKQMIGTTTSKLVPSSEYQRLYELYSDLDFAIKNFAPGSTNGEPITEQSLALAKEVQRGTVAYFLTKNRNVSVEEVYSAVEPNKDGTEVGRADFRDRSGNEVSSQELASKELRAVLTSLFEYTPDGKIVNNEYGFPNTISFELAWNKLLKVISGKASPREMYDALAEKAKQDKAIEQFLNKVGFYEPMSDDDVNLRQINLWSDIYHIFSMPRIPLVNYTINITEDKAGKTEDIDIEISRSKGNTRNIKRDWDNMFVASTNTNPYVVKKADTPLNLGEVQFTGNYLNIAKVLTDFESTYASRPLEFLRALGMNVSDVDEIRSALNAKQGTLRIFVRKMYDKLKYISAKNKGVDSGSKIYVNRPSQLVEYLNADRENDTGAYEELLTLESRYSEKYGTGAVYNASNDLQFEFSLPSTISKRIGYLNNAGSYGNLVTDPRMAYLDTRTNPMARGLMILEELFGEGYDTYDDETQDFKKTNKRVISRKGGRQTKSQIRLQNSAGISLSINEQFANLGVKTFNTDETAFILQNFHTFLKTGMSFGIQHSDKTTTYIYEVARASGQKFYIPISDFADYAEYGESAPTDSLFTEGMNTAVSRMKQYLSNEIARMYRLRNGDPAGKMIAGKGSFYDMGSDFYVFWDILKTDTKKIITDKYLSDNFLEDFGDNTDLMEAIETDIAEYFVTLAQQNYNLIKETGGMDNPMMMQPFRDILLNNPEINDELFEKEGHIDWALIQAFTVNDWIHKFETTVLLYGDPALFDDPFKRDAGGAGTGETGRTDSSMNSILNKFFKPKYSKSKWYERSGLEQPAEVEYGITANTAILEDPEIESPKYRYYVDLAIEEEKERLGVDELSEEEISEIESRYSEYKKMKIGDGQGWCTFDFYRSLLIRLRKWGPYQDELYNRILNGENIKNASRFFPILKLQYWGSLLTEDQLPGLGFHKFSVVPLVPNVIKGTKLEGLHNKMVSQNIDYAAFLSASKINTITEDGAPDKFYDDKKNLGQTSFLADDYKFTPNVIFLDYLKNQQEQTDVLKGKTIYSTQLRTTALMNIYKDGVPTKFMSNETDNIAREDAWNRLTETEKLEYPAYRANKLYKAAITAYSNRLKSDFLKEAGVEEKADGSYEISNKLISYIQKQLSDRDSLGDHEIEFLSKTSDYSLHFNSAEIEKMIMSLVYKKLISQKVNGEPLVQVSSAGFESADNAGLRNATEQEKIDYGAADLNFYTPGKAMKVKIALQGSYKLLLEHPDVLQLVKTSRTKLQKIDALNILIKDENWLSQGDNRKLVTLAGVRIPVQGLNSVEWAEVYEFLPENAGNMVIVPPEIVAKSGSDFDIDKLFMMFPNLIKIGKNIELVTYDENEVANLDENKKLLQELYDELDIEYDELEAKTSMFNEEGVKTDTQDAIYNAIKEYKKEKETIKDILYSGEYELTADDEELLHEKMHEIKKNLAELYNESKDLSREVSEFMNNVINPLLNEISNVKRKIAAASTKGMQNNMLFSTIDLVSLPENFVEFITPNGTYFVKPMADYLQDKVSGVSEYDSLVNTDETFTRLGKKAMPGTRLFELNINNKKRSENNIGKGVLGIGAVHNKYHSVKNIANAYLEPTVVIVDRDSEQEFDIRQTIKMPHNTQQVYGLVEQEDGSFTRELTNAVSLAGVYDVKNKKKISDINGQMINGWVDVAKDAWIFYVQGNRELAPVLQFLIDAGVDYEQAVLFVAQPIIREYAQAQRQIKGVYAKALQIPGANSNRFRDFAKSKILTDYLLKNTDDTKLSTIDLESVNPFKVTLTILTRFAPEMAEAAGIDEDLVDGFPTDELRTRIEEYAKDETKREYTTYDYAVFGHFIELEEMAKADSKIKLTTNDDTQKVASIFELIKRQKAFTRAQAEDRLRPNLIDDVMNKTILGSFHLNQTDGITQVLEGLFELSSNKQFIDFLTGIDFTYSDYKVAKEFPGAFKDKDDFMNALRNDFKIYVIEDFLSASDRFKITAPYKGYKVDGTHAVQRAIKLDVGVAMAKDGTIYIDEAVINNDIANPDKTYLNNEEYMKKRKLAPMPMDYFQNTDPQIRKANYVKFLYERELLRTNIPYEQYSQTKDFKVRLKFAKKYAKSLKEKYDMLPEEYVYETFLRDTALLDKLNIDFMLRDKENGYGALLERFMSTYPKLAEQYPVLNSLRTTVNNETRNVILSEPALTKDMIDDYHDQLVRLADPTYNKVDNDLDNKLISNLFSKLSYFSLFQSGFTGKGNYNLARVFPLDHYSVLIESAKERAKRKLSGNKQKVVVPYLNKFLEMFKLQYKVGGYDEETGTVTAYRAKRVKDYHNDIFAEEAKKGFFQPAPYNTGLTMFSVPKDPKSFLNKLGNDKNAKIIYVSEASLQPASEANTSSLGNFITNSIFQDAVSKKIIPASKVRALVTKKAGIAYSDEDFITDADFEASKAAIDSWIESIKNDIANGKFMVFSPLGYGRVLLGYGGTEQASKAYKLYSKGAPAPKTFVYLSKRLLEVGYINPLFTKMTEFTEVLQTQPFTDEDVKENRRECYKSLYNNE